VRNRNTSDQEGPRPGRHRAAPSEARRAATAAAAGAAGVLVAAVLGVLTAGVVGLTASTAGAGQGGSAQARSPQAESAEPAFRRTVDTTATPTPLATDTPADGVRAVPPAASSIPPPAPRPAPEPSPVRSPVPTVRPGDGCTAEGAGGMSRSGNPMVCTVSPGKGELRWRNA
jgi:hypothetical protein